MPAKTDRKTDALKWAEARVRELKADRKRYKKHYTTITIVMSLINVTIVVMAAIGLDILVKHGHGLTDKNGETITFAIVMTSLAAGLTILIFFINIVNVVYRSVMRWQTYRNAADAIQHEVIKFSLGDDYDKVKDPTAKFEKRVQEIYNNAIHFKRKKRPIKILLNALSGGDNV